MTIYYLSTDRPIGARLLPPVAFKALAFHKFDNAINGQLADLASRWSSSVSVAEPSQAKAWRFRRFRRGNNRLK